MTNKNISISLKEEQVKFIEEQSRWFNLSKFVQSKLDEYMNMVKNYKNINKNEDELILELAESGKGFGLYREYAKDESGKLKRIVKNGDEDAKKTTN